MPPAPAAASLFPVRSFAGIGAVARHRLVARAAAVAGAAHKVRNRPRRVKPPALHPVLQVVAADATVRRLIGAPALAAANGRWPDAEAPSWIALEDAAAMHLVRIGFRGAMVRTHFHREAGARGRVERIDAVESERLYSFEALKEALAAARAALRAAGYPLAAFFEVGQLHGGQSAEAAIGLRALEPAGLSPSRSARATMAR